MEKEKTKSTWGGARAGSGRKRKSESGRVQLQISLTEDERTKIKELAKIANKDVSSFIVSKVLEE